MFWCFDLVFVLSISKFFPDQGSDSSYEMLNIFISPSLQREMRMFSTSQKVLRTLQGQAQINKLDFIADFNEF